MSSTDDELRRTVNKKINALLQHSGLLEYRCPTQNCRTQIFSTWALHVTCGLCGQQVRSAYELDQSWLD